MKLEDILFVTLISTGTVALTMWAVLTIPNGWMLATAGGCATAVVGWIAWEAM